MTLPSTALLDELLDDARAQLASTNPRNWRRALLEEPKRRAKTIPLRETYAASQVPTVTRRNLEGAIDAQSETPRNAVQNCSFAQSYQPSAIEQRLLNYLKQDEYISVKAVAELANLSESTTRDKLEKLDGKGFVESKPRRGGGYRRIK